jgi:hypothetical protein
MRAGNAAVAQLLAAASGSTAPMAPDSDTRSGPPTLLRQAAAPAAPAAGSATPAPPKDKSAEPQPSTGGQQADASSAAAGGDLDWGVAAAPAPDDFDHDMLRSVEVAARIAKLQKEDQAATAGPGWPYNIAGAAGGGRTAPSKPKKAGGPEVARLLDLVPWQWIDAKTGMVRADIGNVLVEQWLPARARQMALRMLDDSEVVTRREGQRYEGIQGQGEAADLRKAAAALADKQDEFMRGQDRRADETPEGAGYRNYEASLEYQATVRAYGTQFPILLASGIDYRAVANASDYDLHLMISGQAAETLANISKSREHIKERRLEFWDLGPVIAKVKEHYGIEPGSYVEQIIERERQSRARSSLIANIALAVLAIGLGLVAVFATGGVALVALGAGAVVSSAQAVEHVVDYQVQKAARGSAFDVARAISADDPSLFWLAVDIAAAVLDLGAAAKAFRTMARVAEDLAQLKQVAQAEARQLEKEGKLTGKADDFVERLMKSARAARGQAGRRARILTEMLQGSGSRVVSLLAADEKAMVRLLREFGTWKDLMTALEHGNPVMKKIGYNLVDFRKSVVERLAKPVAEGGGGVAAKTLGGASAEMVSDVDLQVASGKALIDAESWLAKEFGKNWGDIFRMAVYTEAGRLYKYADVMKALPRAARATLLRRLTVGTERLNFAKMLRHAGHDTESVARVERLMKTVISDERELAKIRELAAVEESAGQALRNQLLVEIDELSAKFATATKEEQIKLAEEITEKQMMANYWTKEAYIGPGAGREAAGGIRVVGLEAYQSAVSQLEMVEHIVHEVGGDVVKAAREYELFKYINRFAGAAGRAGQKSKFLTYFENVSEYLYRVYRGANAEIPPGLPEDWLKRPWVRPSDGTAFPVPRAGDDFLRQQFEEFEKLAGDALPKMRKDAMGKHAGEWAADAPEKLEKATVGVQPSNPKRRTASGELSDR